ncbi:pseudomonalisin [Collimonas sp. PA-H2]|uniref:S53 family peptidase n=1 Tax=Collimonas sp. PA-H2 TaxID=1881062 RepID=UPI000C006DF1|nr:S53 family peptidase [Collimonas sp. PA-H2]PFH11785.1 pseudomonalisin [Collimonas sp. PA-H2]
MKSKKISNDVLVARVSALSLALSLAFSSVSAHAAITDNSVWVPTKTQAFLKYVQAKQRSLATDVNQKTPSEAAVELVQGEPVHVTVSLNLRNEAKLDQFLQELHTPGSASYGKVLTPAQFSEKFAPTEQDVDKVVKHLSKSGFVNITVSPNRQLVSADGTAATVQKGFRTSLKRFQHQGRSVFANTDVVQVPAALGSIIGSVLGLQNVAIAHTLSSQIPTTETSLASQGKAAAVPNATPVKASPNAAAIAAVYNGGNTPTASTTAVAIIAVGNLAPTLNDLTQFTTSNGFAAVNTKVVQTGPVGSSYAAVNGQDEWSLDSQAIIGASGGAVKQMTFYVSPDFGTDNLIAAFNQAVIDGVAKVINVSIGGCESSIFNATGFAASDNVFRQAVAQGQTFSIAAGDAGAYNCQFSPVSGSAGVVTSPGSYDVSWPASSPYVIAVGGTAVYTNAGVYSSETVWNDGLSTIGSYSGGYDFNRRLWATGGGFSKYEPAPAWQGLTGKANRGLPDIAFDAAGINIVYNNQITGLRGTSVAAPIFAGIWARLQSANANGLGFPAASFYKYFPLAANSALLHDVISGTNGTTNANGYKAAQGWDATTGFGSLNISNLNTFVKNTLDFAR